MNVPRKRWISVPALTAASKLHRCRRTFICATSAFICVYTAFLPSAAAAPVSLTDDTGRKVELKAPAKRIVTLAPFLTELAFSAGAGAQIVGVSAYSDYPPAARALPQVASAAGPEIEALAALRPDLVLAWQDSIRPADVERLERLGMRVFVARAKRLEDVPRLLEAFGRLAGRDAAGVADGYRRKLAALREAHATKPRVRAFVEVWHKPLTTIAGSHWINEVLDLCGGENVFADVRAVAPVVSWEEVYRRDPRIVIGAGSGDGERAFRTNWAERASLAAVREGRLAFVDADTLQRPTLRLAEGVASVCAALEKAR